MLSSINYSAALTRLIPPTSREACAWMCNGHAHFCVCAHVHTRARVPGEACVHVLTCMHTCVQWCTRPAFVNMQWSICMCVQVCALGMCTRACVPGEAWVHILTCMDMCVGAPCACGGACAACMYNPPLSLAVCSLPASFPRCFVPAPSVTPLWLAMPSHSLSPGQLLQLPVASMTISKHLMPGSPSPAQTSFLSLRPT